MLRRSTTLPAMALLTLLAACTPRAGNGPLPDPAPGDADCRWSIACSPQSSTGCSSAGDCCLRVCSQGSCRRDLGCGSNYRCDSSRECCEGYTCTLGRCARTP
jgi:hypothetical protein